MAREDLAERLEGAAIGRLSEMDRHFVGGAFTHAVERRNLRCQYSHRLVVPFELAADEHHRARIDQRGGALIRLGKGDNLDAALRVFEREHRHSLAFTRFQLAAAGDDPADTGVWLDRLGPARPPAVVAGGGRLDFGQFANRLRAQLAQRRRVAANRVTTPIQPERLLFKGQLLRLGPRLDIRELQPGGCSRRPGRAGGFLNHRTEQLRLSLLAVALRPRPIFAGGVDRGQQPRTKRGDRQRLVRGPVAQRIEGTRLDEAFEHALVDQTEIELLA